MSGGPLSESLLGPPAARDILLSPYTLLVTVLDDWSPSFPGPFLYYPGRRQRPASLTAFVAFVKEWRKQHRA
jgi:DNA-binding transcriptional LysR family regulator